ncbi:solute carrier family 25 member 35-like isoform X2 [Malaya genurostris]|uniref:solute carrier family 25 member 35-like isoform X2 n=1 Tax=Malaya genurostris TaxID=325434 RepID=UPI0026F38EAD|nr:solute carrier family 25 member 35-like isoform X2 [Malaya genurostris]XP_058457769.1 solute carrier family 25 member 35-like isoform X2 [Malaya genurostris]XP_058457770.1 solute carrier family 25 member 35-like isoform X2 [Malaya genurostris]
MDATDFLLGGVASMAATLFINPLEVIKTRMQLQGELLTKGTYAKPYKNILDAFITIAKNDGYWALQKGLAPSLCFQFVINAVRLGVYNTAYETGLTKTKNGRQSIWKCAFWGGTGGFIGSALASPFFMLRTHLQSQAATQIAVGYQHKHSGMLSALKNIFLMHGIKGLYRGVAVTMPRAMLGSGGQLAGYGYTKDLLTRYPLNSNQTDRIVSFLSGIMAGTVMAITMTPPDVIATRLYNQGVDSKGKGIYYKGVVDCCFKILKTEGVAGLYKGFWPHYMRIGPHSMLVLVFFDELKNVRKYYYSQQMRKS